MVTSIPIRWLRSPTKIFVLFLYVHVTISEKYAYKMSLMPAKKFMIALLHLQNCLECMNVHIWTDLHYDVIKWKHFPRYWPFVRGIHRSPVNSPHEGQRRGALMFSLICVWINGWVNNREAGDLRRYRAHYDVTVIETDVCLYCSDLSYFITESKLGNGVDTFRALACVRTIKTIYFAFGVLSPWPR